MAETNPDDKGTKKSNTIAQQLKRLRADLKELEGLLDSGFGRIKEITGPKRRGEKKKKEIQALVNVFKADQDKYNAAKASIKKVVELSTGLTLKNINNDVVNKIFEELAIIKTNSNFIISRAKLHEALGNKPGYIFTEKAHGYEGTMVFPDLSDFKKGLGNPIFAGDSSKPKSEKSILQRAIENRKRLFSDTNTSIRGSLENALIPKPRKNKEGVAKTTAAKKVREENINYLEKLKSGNLQESEYNKAASAIIKQATGFAKRKESPDFNPAKDTSKYSDDIEKQTGYTLDQILALNATDNKNVGNIIIEGIKRKKEERFSSKISPSNITKSEAKDISEAVTNTSQSIEKESNASGPKPSERRDPKTGLLFLTREMKEAMGIGKNTALAEQVIGKTLAQQQEEASKNIKEEVIINELGAKITKIISPESSPITDIKPIESITGGGSGGGGRSTGSSSPINTAPEINIGKTSSPGEVSDEMLKIIEEAVFNGAARAFSQFSNSPMSGPSEFTDSTIDKIGNTVYEAMKKALDYYSASPALSVVLTRIDSSVIKLLKDELGSLPGGSGTGDMDKLAEELRKSRESNENLAKMQEARRKKAQTEANKKKKAKDDPNSPENIAKAAAEEEKRKKKDQSEPFRKRLRTIYKEGEQELTFLYAKLDSYVGWIKPFNDAILSARKKGLETLRKGYEEFDKKYAESGSAFKGMWASIKAMYSISPFTVIAAGLTTISILLGKTIFNAAQKVNTQIKEISAELGTSNRQSYEMFKNAMNAQTQFENLHASLRDVMDAQKGILGDSGILLRTNDKALSAIADNAKNIGLSVESAGAFYENLRMKGAGDIEANNVMTASLELADKRGFSPQSIVDDIAQNAEFASKYFSKIKQDSKSAHRNLIETNIQVKNLGLNFQKAAKMTQHLLSFEQSITAEVEASVALGTHVDIGKARELLLQDDIAGAMTQMMNAIPGGYEGFQKQDFAQRQLTANALGLEVSELERSLYLREKIKLSNSEDLELAMKHDDYLKKMAGTNDELYRTELSKIQAAERYNTSIERLSVSFRYALAPVLEAVVPVVDLLAGAINKLAEYVKTYVGDVTGANERGEKEGKGSAAPTMIKMGLMGAGGLLMANVMGGHILKILRGKLGGSIKGKIGEIVGKVRGGVDTLTGTLGTKTNPMYVISLGGSSSGMLDGLGGSTGADGKKKRGRPKGSKNKVNTNTSPSTSTSKPSMLKGLANNFKNIKFGSILKNTIKTGGFASAVFGVLDYVNRKQAGQSTAQAASSSIAGVLGGLGGAALGTAIGTMIFPGVGTIVGGAIGLISSMIGGYLGYKAATNISDSAFNSKPSSSYETQPFQYQGMGLSATGSIYGGVNKPKPIGTPVETSMVDMTPTNFKSMSTGLSGITPNYGTTSMSRESVIVNTVSKKLEAAAIIQTTLKEQERVDQELIKRADTTNKLLEAFLMKQSQPIVAYFNEEGRRQAKNYIRKESTP